MTKNTWKTEFWEWYSRVKEHFLKVWAKSIFFLSILHVDVPMYNIHIYYIDQISFTKIEGYKKREFKKLVLECPLIIITLLYFLPFFPLYIGSFLFNKLNMSFQNSPSIISFAVNIEIKKKFSTVICYVWFFIFSICPRALYETDIFLSFSHACSYPDFLTIIVIISNDGGWIKKKGTTEENYN